MGGTEPVPSGIYDGAVFCQRSAMGSKNFQFSATGVGLGALGEYSEEVGRVVFMRLGGEFVGGGSVGGSLSRDNGCRGLKDGDRS